MTTPEDHLEYTTTLSLGATKVADSDTLAAPDDSNMPEPGNLPARTGTCYVDPDTGEYVMPADFIGEKELRWRPDTLPDTSADKVAGNKAESGGNKADAHANTAAVSVQTECDIPLATQYAWFRRFDRACLLHLRALFDDPEHVDRIVDMAGRRLIEGYETYGSLMFSWDDETVERNIDEELADGLVYSVVLMARKAGVL